MRIKLLAPDLYNQRTKYGDMRVNYATVDGENALVFIVNGGAQSAIYTDQKKKDELVFDYMRSFSYGFQLNSHIKNTFMIGGGGFTYPKYYLRAHADAKITVAEISQEAIDIAYRFFGMNELKMEEAKRITVLAADGIRWLKEHETKYDFIINDAFIGPIAKGRDDKSVRIIHDHLSEDGIYVVNVLASVTGRNTKHADRMNFILRKYFKYTAMMIVDEEAEMDEMQNILIFASDREFV